MPDREYNRPNRDRQYISIQKHHHTSRNKYGSKWISFEIEKDTFDSADYGNFRKNQVGNSWEDLEGNLWGFLLNIENVGTKGEIFGFFDKPRNITDRWHGYPIFPFAPRSIPNNLVERWINEGLLDEDDISTLIKKKKI